MDESTSAAEQRAFAVAKLKRAASLPRMKDGRRPPMHVEAVSEGEKTQPEDKQESDTPPTGDITTDVPQEEKRGTTPEPANRTKRRSRSRSRSRGSKDFKGKMKPPQSPSVTPLIPSNDSSPEDSPPPPPPALFPPTTPVISPIPSHFTEMQQASRLLMSPALLSPESPLLYPGTSPPTPMLPTLEALQKGLFRSNSAAARMMAMQKLTRGNDVYDNSFPSPSPTPPPLPGKLGRNNTVSGGERSAARKFLLQRLGERIKEADGEQTSGGEEKDPVVPVKRRRRRSGRNSSGAGGSTTTEESGFGSTSATTPISPPVPLPSARDISEPPRTASTTPIQTVNVPSLNLNETLAGSREATPVRIFGFNHFDQEPPRKRRSILIEDPDEEERDRVPPQHTYLGLPGTPNRPSPSISPRIPHSSDAPSYASTDSASPSAIGVPVYLSVTQKTPSKQDPFPISPFTTPLKEKPSRDEDEEEVLYEAEYQENLRRSPYHDVFAREISWIAEPVPESRMPIHDDDYTDEDAEEEEQDELPPESPKEEFLLETEDSSTRASSDSKELVVELETSPEPTPSFTSPTPSSLVPPSHTTSTTRASDDSGSPKVYPQRLSVASRIQSDRSPLNTDFEWDDSRGTATETSSKRTGDGSSTTTWGRLKDALTRSNSGAGRRSRTNSIVTRERRDHTDSSVSRESGASLTSPKATETDSVGTFTYPQNQQQVMQSSSASTSMLSLAPQTPPRGGVSPIPPASSADLLKYKDAKLFPFPGMKKLEEQRNRARGMSLSSSTPDIVFSLHGNDSESQALPSSSSSNTPSHSPEMARDRKLSHQASDTRLLAKFKNMSSPPISAAPSSSSHQDYFNAPPLSPSGSVILKPLPTNREGVRKWLNAKKLFSQGSSSPSPTTPPVVEVRQPASKKPSLSDLFRRKENDLTTEWEEVAISDKSRTPTSASGSTVLGKFGTEVRELTTTPTVNGTAPAHEDLQKTPRASKVAPSSSSAMNGNGNGNGMQFSLYNASPALPSPPEPPSSATPDPLSSLSDYPARSTSESSSNTSSQYSHYPSQGLIVLERIDDMLGRGSRSPMWASAIDDPPRKLLLSSPVLQVVNSNTVKDRFLFLFNDILVIAKPIIQDQDGLLDMAKPNPLDRKFVVKNVVLLRHLCFSADREEPQAKTASYANTPRNPIIRSFIHQFSTDPDHAISTLFAKSGCRDDPAALGQLLFRTLEVDRSRLGDYLSRRTSKVVLKYYVDAFGFTGLRLDKALRVFLLSINMPTRSSHGNSPLEQLLEALASRWYEANVGHVAYDKDLAVRFVRAIVQLNDVLHGDISPEPGPTGYAKRNVTASDFLEAFRRYDPRGLVSDDLLGDIYDSIRKEKLFQARNPSTGGSPDIAITIKRSLPPRLTYRVQSEPIILKIPQVDPNLTIQLFGQDITFEPPVLTFVKSTEASFRVTGTSFGPKNIIMLRSGPNANMYSGLPLSCSLVVERAFMRNTFQVAFSDHNAAKRKYMFSVDDPVIRHEWTVSLKREVEASTNAASASSMANRSSALTFRFHQAASHIAFKVLQDTLINPDGFAIGGSSTLIGKALHRRAPSVPHHNRDNSRGSIDPNRNGTLIPIHNRSKSRSKMYHRLGPGKLEPDNNHNGDATFNSRASKDNDEHGEDSASPEEGRLWSGRDLEMYCQQNSSIALVLAYLQIGAPDHANESS
ncbi:hypothetical protein SERLA73DRAFT_152020 [Serpula lacrymans var. lacrymans S7.3]|uniref:SEC7 domain-containing protein n=1 Tax=Serpula lacrymans var. lacrymans (strain S7.3) TaxID=936435 RepID=F8PVA0_SERL3|nr:hypothetical protein SERLA73DRAFT_152020 [Serpula lacrymans var. lacrymans S7.3]